MAHRLTTTPNSPTPKTWFLECKYCQSSADKNQNQHEVELLDKARKLCRNHTTNHFLDYLTAEFDTLDHSILTPITMIEILTQIHTTIGCDCNNPRTTEIEHLTKSPLPTPTTPTFAPPTPTRTPPKKPAKTLLERLQNGKNGAHKPQK